MMETRASSNRFVPSVTKSFREILVEETPRPAAGAALRRLGEFLARGLAAAARTFCARVLRLADARHVSALRIKARAASILDAAVKPLDSLLHTFNDALSSFNMAREKSLGRSIKRGLASLLTAGAIGLGSLVPRNSNADMIRVRIDPTSSEIDGSTMFLRNMEGGELGYDENDSSGWPERLPWQPDVWLRVYSDQWKVYYNNPNAYPLWIDARPYSGPGANQPFPLRADVQGLGEGETISANNCYFTFQAQNGYGTGGGYRDEGLRDLYAWTLSLNPSYAQFTDGSYSKSGVFDLREGPTHSTPAFNIWNVPGNTAFLEFDLLPIPEPSTVVIAVCGAVAVGMVRRFRRRDPAAWA